MKLSGMVATIVVGLKDKFGKEFERLVVENERDLEDYFTDQLDDLYDRHLACDRLEKEAEQQEYDIRSLERDLELADQTNDELQEKIDELEEEILELKKNK